MTNSLGPIATFWVAPKQGATIQVLLSRVSALHPRSPALQAARGQALAILMSLSATHGLDYRSRLFLSSHPLQSYDLDRIISGNLLF